MGQVYTRFQTKTAQKTLPDRAAHTYMANIREYPPENLVTSPNKSSSTELQETLTSYMPHTNDYWDWNVDMC